jgi:hypothetical protein
MKIARTLTAALTVAALMAPMTSHAAVASGGWPVSSGASTLLTTFTRNNCQLVGGVNHMDGSVLRFKTRPSTNQPIQISVTATAWLAVSESSGFAMVNDACEFLHIGRTTGPLTLLKNTRYLILNSWPAADVRWTISCAACSPSNLEY